MINEVTVTAKFITGTTEQDPERAKEVAKKILLKALANASIYPEIEKHGLFAVEIIAAESEKI